MSENIPITDSSPSGSDLRRDSSTGGMAESQVETPKAGGVSPVGNYHKKFPILTVLFLIILTVISVICVYLFLQVRTLTLDKYAPSPTPTPMVSSDPAEGWNSYLLEPIGLTLKYPDEIEATDDVVDNAEIKGNYNYFIMYPGTDQIFLNITLYKSSSTPLNWWDTVGKQKFEKIASEDGKYMNPPADIKLTYDVKNIFIDNLEAINVKIVSNHSTIQIPLENNLIIFQKNGYIATIKYSKFSEDSLTISNQILSTFKFSDSSTGPDTSWQTYKNTSIGYSIQYPSGWRKQEWDGGIGFGPKEIGEDVILGISYYSKEDTEQSNFIDEIGSQFADRVAVRDSIMINQIKVDRVIVTTPSFPDWYSESIIFETDKDYIVVGNGAMKDENLPFSRGIPKDFTFAKFYQTFKLTL